MSDLVGPLAGGGVVGAALAVALAVAAMAIRWLRQEHADGAATERRIQERLDAIEVAHIAERTRLQTVIDDERAKRRAGEDEAAQRIRAAEDEVARLRRLVRELGGDPR